MEGENPRIVAGSSHPVKPFRAPLAPNRTRRRWEALLHGRKDRRCRAVAVALSFDEAARGSSPRAGRRHAPLRRDDPRARASRLAGREPRERSTARSTSCARSGSCRFFRSAGIAARYEAALDKHHHIICSECRELLNVRADGVAEIARAIAEGAELHERRLFAHDRRPLSRLHGPARPSRRRRERNVAHAKEGRHARAATSGARSGASRIIAGRSSNSGGNSPYA